MADDIFVWLVLILSISIISMLFNVGYILHELGWYPHTKDRKSPADRTYAFRSRYEERVLKTHGFQVVDPHTNILRRFGHADIYKVDDPYKTLENIIKRYEEKPIRSRYDDLINVSNYICCHVKCDDRTNALIDQIHQLIHSRPITRS